MAPEGRKLIGITGGIGAGKSVVSRVLRLMGHSVYDCDLEARRLMETDPELRRELTAILGEGAYSGGRLDRRRVAELIFGDEALRGEVNRLVHRAVCDDLLREASMQEGLVFVESALLATSGLDRLVGSIWLVEAPMPTRLGRVMRRNGMEAREVMERMEAQEMEFRSLPEGKTFTVGNGDGEALMERIMSLLTREGAPYSGAQYMETIEIQI